LQFPATLPYDVRILVKSSNSTAGGVTRATLQHFGNVASIDWPRLQSRRAIITLITNKAYLLAGCVLASSLRRVQTRYPIIAAVTREMADDDESVAKLTIAGVDYLIVVDKIDNPAHLAQATAGEKDDKIQAHKADVFTKLRIFALDEFTQFLYIDADCVVARNGKSRRRATVNERQHSRSLVVARDGVFVCAIAATTQQMRKRARAQVPLQLQRSRLVSVAHERALSRLD
jgi:hypothetical protein